MTDERNDELLRRHVAEQCARVAKLRIWKRRLPTDDGWEFEACEHRPSTQWLPANEHEVTLIAARALTGAW